MEGEGTPDSMQISHINCPENLLFNDRQFITEKSILSRITKYKTTSAVDKIASHGSFSFVSFISIYSIYLYFQ